MNAIVKLILIVGWVIGVVLAKGFWWTVLAIYLPLYAWYLTVEHFMVLFKLL